MKFTMNLSAAAAATAANAILEAVWTAPMYSEGYDWVKATAPDGEVVSPRPDRSGEEWLRPERRPAVPLPTNFLELVANAASSKITLTREGENYRLKFEGLRGSLSKHWWGVKALLQEAEEEGAKVEDYESSIQGMLPWEGLQDWYLRMTGKAEGPNPFRADTGPHTGAYCLPPEEAAEDEAYQRFNQRFFAAIKQMAAKGKLNPHNLRVHAKLIENDLRRLHKLAA